MMHESEREAQREYGRRVTETDRVSANSTQTTRTVTDASGAFKRRADAKRPAGHEAFLKAIEASGGGIWFRYLDEDPNLVHHGMVKHSDKFTVSIDVQGATRVVFKHALRDFGPEKRA
jgi:hypothetical protein